LVFFRHYEAYATAFSYTATAKTKTSSRRRKIMGESGKSQRSKWPQHPFIPLQNLKRMHSVFPNMAAKNGNDWPLCNLTNRCNNAFPFFNQKCRQHETKNL
jgi:hypothetical protein